MCCPRRCPIPITGTTVVVNSQGQLGVATSSPRFKRNISTMGDSSGAVMKLRPVTFVYKNDLTNTRQYGLIAEEVRQVYPELVTYDSQGKLESVRYEQLIPMLLNELQRQQRDFAELKSENRMLTALQQVQGRVEQMADRCLTWLTVSVVFSGLVYRFTVYLAGGFRCTRPRGFRDYLSTGPS
jgi:Chaperone of endosialidase